MIEFLIDIFERLPNQSLAAYVCKVLTGLLFPLALLGAVFFGIIVGLELTGVNPQRLGLGITLTVVLGVIAVICFIINSRLSRAPRP